MVTWAVGLLDYWDILASFSMMFHFGRSSLRSDDELGLVSVLSAERWTRPLNRHLAALGADVWMNGGRSYHWIDADRSRERMHRHLLIS